MQINYLCKVISKLWKYPVLVQNSILLQNVIENRTLRLCGQMFNVINNFGTAALKTHWSYKMLGDLNSETFSYSTSINSEYFHVILALLSN